MLLRIHIMAASFWIGLIVVETIIELLAVKGSEKGLRFVTRAHKVVDTYFEGPVVAIVLVTGSMLLYELWPNISFLLAVKVLTGLVAVVVNIICIYFVLARASAEDEATFQQWEKRVLKIGPWIPVAYVTFAIGLYGV